MDDMASAAQGATGDPSDDGASSTVPTAVPQESGNESDSPPAESGKVELSPAEYARLQAFERDYSHSSREARQWREKAEALEQDRSRLMNGYDPKVASELNPYIEPVMNPVQEKLSRLEGALTYLAQEREFEAEARKHPELSMHHDRIRDMWMNSNLPPERVFSMVRDVIETGTSENSRVISEKRTVRLEGSRASNKTAPRQKSLAEMSDAELKAAMQDPNSALRAASIEAAKAIDPRAY